MTDGESRQSWYSRTVFFVRNAETSLAFYTEKLGCKVDWNHREGGRSFVFQASRPGLELILCQEDARAGHGRVFVTGGKQATLRQEVEERGIPARDSDWGGIPVIEIRDPDGNELLFAFPDDKSDSPS